MQQLVLSFQVTADDYGSGAAEYAAYSNETRIRVSTITLKGVFSLLIPPLIDIEAFLSAFRSLIRLR